MVQDSPEPRGSPRPKRKLRVAIADDERDTVVTLATLLQQEGHEVLEIYRGDAVLELVRRYKPDVLLLDIGMPQMSGFEIARQLRAELRHSCPILIAVTGWKQQQAKEMGKVLGFYRYLTKPYEPRELLETLAELP
jgi:DNA-binding response OmpR family regulator